jgi:hypothetical protein
MKFVSHTFTTLAAALALGRAALPALAGPDWQAIEYARKVHTAMLNRGHTPEWTDQRVERVMSNGKRIFALAFRRWLVEQAASLVLLSQARRYGMASTPTGCAVG